MALVEHYAAIKLAHIVLVSTSGSVFAARGALVLLGQADVAMAPWLRRASMLIDSLLLAAGGTLWALLQLNPARDAWLGVKLGAVLAYIVLGTLALKRAPSPRAKAVCYVAALACFGFVVSVVRAHHPLGIFA